MIREVKVKNFKCFEELTLPFRQVNLLAGVNGMGKSTLLQSLLLLKQSALKNNGMKGLSLNGAYISLGNAQDVLYEKAESETIGLGYTDDLGEHFWNCQYRIDSDFLPVIAGEEQTDADTMFGGHLNYLSAYRIQPRELYSAENEEEVLKREFGNNGEFALQYLGICGDAVVENRQVVIEDKLGNTLQNQTRIWMDKISPGVSPKVLVNMQLKKSELRYEFIEGKEKTKTYKSVNVGFGITYVLPLIIAILSAQKGDLLILENPEAHIHPAGQRALGELIARAGAGGVQILAETHSDHILNGVRMAVKKQQIAGENVMLSFFYKDAQDHYRHQCVHPMILPDGRLDRWPDGFFDEWDKMLYELI